MDISISDKSIEDMVEQSVRKRVKEMQGNYTSKAYLEDLIKKVIWDKIKELCPHIEDEIRKEVEISTKTTLKSNLREVKKSELLNMILDDLLDNVERY